MCDRYPHIHIYLIFSGKILEPSTVSKYCFMKKKPKDRHLDVPSEANRDKHINFLALENRDRDLSSEPATGKLAPNKNPRKLKERK